MSPKRTKKKRTRVPSGPTYPVVIETFRPFGAYEASGFTSNFSEPSCFNGDVKIRRYRITVEEIQEPVEVLAERLQKLWEESDNYHHYHPLQVAAEEIGYELQGEFGAKRKRKS